MKLFAVVGAGVLAGALLLPWYLVYFPDGNLRFDSGWEDSPWLSAVLTLLALLALRFRAAAGIAAAIIVARLVFGPGGDWHREAGPWLALLGALVAAFPEPLAVTRVGAVAVLGALAAPWYATDIFIITRGSVNTETLTDPGQLTLWETSAPVAVALAALGVLMLVRPSLARAVGWAAVALAFSQLISPRDTIDYGGWVALAGSILAWAGGLTAHRPNITDRCSPATRSSTSPASPASS